MSTKFGKRAQRPPLSKLDNAIYSIMIALGVPMMIFYTIFLSASDLQFLFADSSVVASGDCPFILCSMPLVIFVGLTLTILGALGLKKRQPLFESKNYISNALSPTLKVYPLFSEKFRESPDRKKFKKIAMILAIVLTACILISILGIFPRQTLDKDGTLRTYDILNRVTHTESIENVENVIFEIEHTSGYRYSTSHWYVKVNLYFENENYGFRLENFQGISTEKALRYMLSLKVELDGHYELQNIEALNKLLNEGYTQEECLLILELFDLYEN